jgi:hypothetical protein
MNSVIPDTSHTHMSSYRESLLEHLFVGEIMKHCWLHKLPPIEVLKSQVDNAGYDLVLESRGMVRHVQLKASHEGAATSRLPINRSLASKPNGCVIWMIFDPMTLGLTAFYWYGEAANAGRIILDGLPDAKHAKANSQGIKTIRPNVCYLPRQKMMRINSVDELIVQLFGPMSAIQATTTPEA